MNATGFEIVLVDDASTDSTPEVLKTLVADNPEISIRIATAEKNLGVSGARNLGLDFASKPVVAYTDSDCTVDVHWITRLVKPFSNTAVAAVAGTVIDDPPTNLAEHAFFGCRRIGQNAAQRRRLIGGNMAIKTEVLRVYRFDEQLTYGCDEDDLAYRLAKDGYQFASATDAVVYHHHPLTMSDYWKQAWKQGRGSAHFWRKTGTWFGRDILGWPVTGTAILIWLFETAGLHLALVGLLFQLAACLFNSVVLKRKSPGIAIATLPSEILFTLVKFLSVCVSHCESIVLRITKRPTSESLTRSTR